MGTVNERIKAARKHFRLTQKEFAQTLGISQAAVSWGEQPGNNVPDSTIKAICMAFHINEAWLRTGTSPMIEEPDTFSLDQFAQERGCTELELEILKTYFELDLSAREAILSHFKIRLAAAKKIERGGSNPESQKLSSESSGMDTVAEIAELKRQNQALEARIAAMEQEEQCSQMEDAASSTWPSTG